MLCQSFDFRGVHLLTCIAEAERAKFIVERSEQERQAAVIRAEGESEAAIIISRALDRAGEGLVQMRRIEASRDIASTLVSTKSNAPIC